MRCQLSQPHTDMLIVAWIHPPSPTPDTLKLSHAILTSSPRWTVSERYSPHQGVIAGDAPTVQISAIHLHQILRC